MAGNKFRSLTVSAVNGSAESRLGKFVDLAVRVVCANLGAPPTCHNRQHLYGRYVTYKNIQVRCIGDPETQGELVHVLSGVRILAPFGLFFGVRAGSAGPVPGKRFKHHQNPAPGGPYASWVPVALTLQLVSGTGSGNVLIGLLCFCVVTRLCVV